MYLHVYVTDSWVTVPDQAARAGGLLKRISELEHAEGRAVLGGVAFSESEQPPAEEPAGDVELVGDDTSDLWFYFVTSGGEDAKRLSYDEVRQPGIWGVEESLARLSQSAADDVVDRYLGWFVSASKSADVDAETAIGLYSLL